MAPTEPASGFVPFEVNARGDAKAGAPSEIGLPLTYTQECDGTRRLMIWRGRNCSRESFVSFHGLEGPVPLPRALGVLPVSLALIGLADCDYVRMLRPSVLSELTPPVARLVNELPDLDAPYKATVAQLYAVGGLSHASEGADGRMHASIVVPPHRMMWEPAVIDMPHGGPLELRSL